MHLRIGFVILFFASWSSLVYAQQVEREVLLKDIEYLSSEELEGRKPMTEGSVKARQYLSERFVSLGMTSQFKDYTQSFPLFPREGGDVLGEGINVIGFIPGEETEKIIVITAHYDHLGEVDGAIYLGADDNASGTAALLALAAYFSENKPRHSMIFAALDAEEMGLQGAHALVSDFPFPLNTVILNINLDMISKNERNELYAVGTAHYPHLRPLLEAASKETAIRLLFGHDKPGTDMQDWTHSSDHAAFHEKGIPFVYFGVEDHEDYHKATDTFERIDQDFYYQAVNLILACTIMLDREL